MAILINKNSRVLVLGITGRSGALQTELMLASGTNIVAGVTPGKGGQIIHDVPVYDSIAEAVEYQAADTAISFVPPFFAKDSCFEAIDAGIRLVVLTTEGMPIHDTVETVQYSKMNGVRLIGPGCSGIIIPGECKVGSHPVRFFAKGSVGVVSKSGALSYETGKMLSDSYIGQSGVVGIGGGPIWGFTQRDVISLYENDPDTELIVILGEIGGNLEEEAATYIRDNVTKPVVALIVGRSAPKGQNLGHAGAIIRGEYGTAISKIKALKESGAYIVNNPEDLVKQVRLLLH